MDVKKESVRAEKVTIHFEAGKCVHSRNCVLSRPDVFVPNVKGEWIHPERATPDEVATLALNCPSGAITYERFDGLANESGTDGEYGARARERAARLPWCARPPGDRRHLSRHPVPVRRVGQQALLRRKPRGGGLRGHAANRPPSNPSRCRTATVRCRLRLRPTGRLGSPVRWRWSVAPVARSIAPRSPFCAAAAPRPTSRSATAATRGSASAPLSLPFRPAARSASRPIRPRSR